MLFGCQISFCVLLCLFWQLQFKWNFVTIFIEKVLYWAQEVDSVCIIALGRKNNCLPCVNYLRIYIFCMNNPPSLIFFIEGLVFLKELRIKLKIGVTPAADQIELDMNKTLKWCPFTYLLYVQECGDNSLFYPYCFQWWTWFSLNNQLYADTCF